MCGIASRAVGVGGRWAEANELHASLVIEQHFHPERVDVRIIDGFSGVALVHYGRQAQLAQIAGAVNALRFELGLGQGWQKHSRENGNDRDHDQQLDEGESAARRHDLTNQPAMVVPMRMPLLARHCQYIWSSFAALGASQFSE